ncbi:MAG TPA: LPS export ABC transporter permease LptF [Burkholderiaceae bacterium]|jgi:lipopolysaccharide export system permease protein|nr:LPS export ABC transporter permease LptF [Burkholderiaceae bacterium]
MIFQRAIARELASTAGAFFTVLFCILFSVGLVRILGEAANGEIDSSAVASLLALSALTNLPIVLTLTVFGSVLMAMSRAFRDSEMVVWFTAGRSLLAWVPPVIRFALPIVLLIAVLTLLVAPWANGQIAESRSRFEQRDDLSKVMPGRFAESSSADRVFFVESVDLEGARVRNVFVAHHAPDRDSVIAAAEGEVQPQADGTRLLILHKGRRYEGLPGEPGFRVVEFGRYSVPLDQPVQTPFSPATARALPTLDLLVEPKPLHQGELLWRLGVPVMAVMLALLAVPLAFVNPRIGRSANLIVAVLLFVLYLDGIQITQAWVQQGRIGFLAGAWLAHTSAFALLVVLFVRRVYLQRWAPRWSEFAHWLGRHS